MTALPSSGGQRPADNTSKPSLPIGSQANLQRQMPQNKQGPMESRAVYLAAGSALATKQQMARSVPLPRAMEGPRSPLPQGVMTNNQQKMVQNQTTTMKTMAGSPAPQANWSYGARDANQGKWTEPTEKNALCGASFEPRCTRQRLARVGRMQTEQSRNRDLKNDQSIRDRRSPSLELASRSLSGT
uniref:BAT2_N domain-containing protein n=1 Tax=Steinernema glaseri TaxID=37863 RepID=A0A1I8AC86_9BILA